MNLNVTEVKKTQFPEVIMQYVDKIVNKLLDYIQKNINDIGFLKKRLSYLDDYLSDFLSQKTAINFFPKNNTILTSYNYNASKNSIEDYKITKLKRKLKQQHEIFQMKELAYLERLVIFQNKLQKIELENYRGINKYLLLKNSNNLCTEYLCSNNKSHRIGKGVINTDSNLIKNNKRTNIKSASPINISPLNTIATSSLSSPKKKEDKSYNKTINNFHKNRKKSAKVGNRSVSEFNRMSNDITANNRFENIFRLKKKKIKKINDSSVLKYDFDEIKKSVEDGRKKMMLLKNSIAPRFYEKPSII